MVSGIIKAAKKEVANIRDKGISVWLFVFTVDVRRSKPTGIVHGD